ncbi:MAG: hypothetical protein KDJ87_00145 [Rhizobiaceae bacterium]|nr:hypothetical protein [Rhizobiaceae bacterium]
MNGAGGDDIIDGGRGKDSIIGNGGDDELTGGIGADHFIYHKGDGSDVITDFTARGGDADTIDLSEYGEKIRFRDLHISRVDKTDVLIEIGRHEDILLHDVKLRHISVDDFDF